MRILGVIPARYASSRFPGKPLLDLKGKSMIQRVVEGASKSGLLTDVVVATDDSRIEQHVQSFGGKVVMTASSHRSGTDRCGEVIENWLNYDVVINIQGDEPLVDYRQIDQLIGAFNHQKTQIATLASPKINQEDLINPNRIKVVVDANDRALYFSRSAIPNTFHSQQENPLEFYPFLRHIGLYGYRTEVLRELVKLSPTKLEQTESLEQLRWLYHGYAIQVVQTNIETPNIDTPDDLEEVLRILNNLEK